VGRQVDIALEVRRADGGTVVLRDRETRCLVDNGGSVLGRVFRDEDRVRLRWELGIEFSARLQEDRILVTATPFDPAATASVAHVFRNHVRPMILGELGALVLHGASVELAPSIAASFVGVSGRGKSTLAAAFALRGFKLLADDHFEVMFDAAGANVLPSDPLLKLRAPSVDALGLDDSNPLIESAISLGGDRVYDHFQYSAESALSPILYWLSDKVTDSVVIDRVAPAAAMRELISHVYYLDTYNPETLPRQFRQLSELAQKTKFFSLAYPRRFDRLHELIETVIAHHAAHRD
jgi:hypothetical protein